MTADLRLIVVTDDELAAPRSTEQVVAACLEAGAPAVQLRDKRSDDGALLGRARGLRALCARHGALFFVNDRADIALACGADGVHLGPDDVPPDAVRRVVPDGFLIGWSTDSARAAAGAARLGVDYIGCGAVFGTSSKVEAAGERIGPDGLARVVAASTVPVVAIGGITPANAGLALAAGVVGVAAVSALMSAPDPGAVVRALLTH
ncbi:MAG: thiamine phosphate synthase [Gemmatimonadota bacterium]